MVSVVISVATASIPGLTLASLVYLGLAVVGGKLVDGFTKTLQYTDFIVATKVYFNGTYTANLSKVYDKVIVSGNVYLDDYYGYNIVTSFASSSASSAARAFNDKYITASKPTLKLPITSTSY